MANTNVKDVVMKVLAKHDGEQINLESQAAKEMLSEEISTEVTNWIRNLYTEDFQP
tara:strand:- start:423 stop:590 length:168 start_codon:yes stop_codon:yes gene_type:complete